MGKPDKRWLWFVNDIGEFGIVNVLLYIAELLDKSGFVKQSKVIEKAAWQLQRQGL